MQMTNEQATKILARLSKCLTQYARIDGDEERALDMAIEALSNSQKKTESLIKTNANTVSDADVINRQDAIDAVKRNTFRLTFAEEQNCEGHVAWSAEAVYSDVMEGELLELPSAQPERKKGEWVDTEFLKLKECSCCHSRWGMYDVENFDFCPNCGARMDGGE